MALKKIALVVILAGAALVPAATASAAHHHVKIRFGRVPLQTAQFGPAGASLALNSDSGPISGDEVEISGSGEGAIFAGRGDATRHPLGGWALDYGDPYTGGTGVTEIYSSVEGYKTPAVARKVLSFARFDAEFLTFVLQSSFVSVTEQRIKTPRVGQRRFGFLVTEAAPNLNPIVRLDEQVAAGRFVLELTVTAGSASAAESIAPHLLLVLHRRLQLMLAGRDTGKPPRAPGEPQPGQAPGGPDLSTLILQPTDVGQSHAVNLFQSYISGPPALSDFALVLQPAGTYDELEQQVAWWPTATEAIYAETYGGGSGPFLLGLFAGEGGTATPVDVSTVGDNATAYLLQGDGQSVAEVALTNGQAGETVVGVSQSAALTASDVQSLAQAAANRLDAGLGP